MLKKIEPIDIDKLPDKSYCFERRGQIKKNGMVVYWNKRRIYGQVQFDTYDSKYDMKDSEFWNKLFDEVRIQQSASHWSCSYAIMNYIPKEKVDYVIEKILYELADPDKGNLTTKVRR